MKLSFDEQETIIRWDRRNPEAIVYTFEPALKNRLKEMESQFPDKVQLDNEDNGSVEYIIPKELISIRKPRVLSDETKEKYKQILSKARQTKRPEEEQLEEESQLQAF